jgi:hypothetical protein
MLNKLAEIYNRQDIVDAYKYGVFNYIDYFDLLNRFKIDEYKSYQVRIIKRRNYTVDHNAYISYNIDNKIHRDNDKPAIEYASGTKEWCKNGELHRDNDQPAREWTNGTKSWWKNDKRHRDNDKPALERVDGTKEWYQNGIFVRSSKN